VVWAESCGDVCAESFSCQIVERIPKEFLVVMREHPRPEYQAQAVCEKCIVEEGHCHLGREEIAVVRKEDGEDSGWCRIGDPPLCLNSKAASLGQGAERVGYVDMTGRCDPFCESLVAILRLVECGDLLSKGGEDSVGGIAMSQIRSRWKLWRTVGAHGAAASANQLFVHSGAPALNLSSRLFFSCTVSLDSSVSAALYSLLLVLTYHPFLYPFTRSVL
jgi:hypothetical protein